MTELKSSGSSVKAYQFMLKIRYINQLREYPSFNNVVFGPVKGFKDIKTLSKQ